MCSRFTLQLSPELLEAVFGIKTSLQYAPSYHFALTQRVPVVRETAAGERRRDELAWGLIGPLLQSRARQRFIHED